MRPKQLMKDIDKAAKKLVKPAKKPKAAPKEPTDAVGWLKKAYIEDQGKGAPKVGNIGYLL